jgi:hypothetical protein
VVGVVVAVEAAGSAESEADADPEAEAEAEAAADVAAGVTAVERMLKTGPFGSEPSVETVAAGGLPVLEVLLFMLLQSSGLRLFPFEAVVPFGNGTA